MELLALIAKLKRTVLIVQAPLLYGGVRGCKRLYCSRKTKRGMNKGQRKVCICLHGPTWMVAGAEQVG